MGERPRTWQQTERRALVADLVRTQATLEARTEQLREIFDSRWYRLARFFWRLRRGRLRRPAPPRPAGEDSFARPLDGGGERANGASPGGGATAQSPAELRPVPGLARGREGEAAAGAGALEPGGAAAGEPPRLLLAGHSLVFSAGIARRAREAGAAVREDRWRAHGTHHEEASGAALAWADTILCEWCLGNAVWYSRNKLDRQRLVVRFHRMELDTPYPGEVDLERVDAIVFVARHVLERACERWGWDPADPRFRVVPNGVDAPAEAARRPAGAEHTLAMVGYVPRLKRLDRALDLLAALRRRDERFRLLVKGREPWEHDWIGGRDEDRAYYEALGERLEREPELRGAVRFEPFGDDVAEFLGRAGWIVSASEVEGHSVALAEGMAAGAVPVILERPGAGLQYLPRWVHADVEAAARWMLTVLEHGKSSQESATAYAWAAESWGWERLGPQWDELLRLGEPAAARPPDPAT
jgi:glycosyltransferase involved in cell wall biosynthesis